MSRNHARHRDISRGAASIELIESLFARDRTAVTMPEAAKLPARPEVPAKLVPLVRYHQLADGSVDVLLANPWLAKPLQALADKPELHARVGSMTPTYGGVELNIKSSAAKKDIARVEVWPDNTSRVTRKPESDALQQALRALQTVAPERPSQQRGQRHEQLRR